MAASPVALADWRKAGTFSCGAILMMRLRLVPGDRAPVLAALATPLGLWGRSAQCLCHEPRGAGPRPSSSTHACHKLTRGLRPVPPTIPSLPPPANGPVPGKYFLHTLSYSLADSVTLFVGGAAVETRDGHPLLARETRRVFCRSTSTSPVQPTVRVLQ